MTSPTARAELERLIADGLQRYRRGDIDGALAMWERALTLAPGDARAAGYVDYVRQHYEELVPSAPSPIAELLVPFELGATAEEEDDADYEVMISRGDPPPMAPPRPPPASEHLAETWRGGRLGDDPPPEDGWPIEGSGVGRVPTDDAYESITLGSAGRASQEFPLDSLRLATDESGETTLGGYAQRRSSPGSPTRDLGGDFGREHTGEPTRERLSGERRRITSPLGMAPLVAPAARPTAPQTPQTLRGSSGGRPPAPGRTPSSTQPPPPASVAPAPSRTQTPVPDPVARTRTPATGPITRPVASAPVRTPPPAPAPSRTITPVQEARTQTAPSRSIRRTQPPPPAHPRYEDLDIELGLGLDLDVPGSPAELGIETLVPGAEPGPPSAPSLSSSIDDRAVHVEELRLPPPITQRVRTIDNDDLAPPLPPLASLGGPDALLLADIDRDRPPRESAEDVARRRIPRLIDRARAAAASGEPEVVVAAIELALAQSPDSAVAQKLIHKHRDVLLDCYYRYFGSLEKRPVVTGDLTELKGGGGKPAIDPRAAFLLSRIDGMLTYDELLDVSGMGRLEACRHLAHLIGRGLVRST